jgi:ABC-type lipoprotein export system ATPase subunit
MIEITGLVYRNRAGKSIVYPDWNLHQGQQALVTGRTGTGKSTLLYLLAGLLKKKLGKIVICDHNIDHFRRNEFDRFRGKRIGFLTPSPYFLPEFPVLDNLLIAQHLGSGTEDIERVFMLLHELGLIGHETSYLYELSPYQARVADVIRAIMNKPQLILADEPTTGLSEKESMKIYQMLAMQSKIYESTLIIASRDPAIREIFRHQLKLENA